MNVPSDIAIQWMSYAPEGVGAWEAMLSPAEHTRMNTFTHTGRRHEFVLGRAAARTLLAQRLGVEPAHVPLHVAEDGAVDVPGANLSVSITHSRKHAVAAIAERAIGIDLEHIAPRHPGLSRFLLHPDEYPTFDALPLDRTHALILYWTVKEATLKALRTGFRLSPKKLRVDIDVSAQQALVKSTDGPTMQVQFEERAACYFAVAYASP